MLVTAGDAVGHSYKVIRGQWTRERMEEDMQREQSSFRMFVPLARLLVIIYHINLVRSLV
jgi:hypothetical protein